MAAPTFFSLIFLLLSQAIFAQDSLFFARSNRSLALDFSTSNQQCLYFKTRDIVYNKVATLNNNKLTIDTDGYYEINAFANINLGTFASKNDSLQLQLSVVKNNQTILSKTTYTYRYGNFDVAAGLQITPFETKLENQDEICLCVTKIYSTFQLNTGPKFHHISKPTGMPQIMGLRMKKQPTTKTPK